MNVAVWNWKKGDKQGSMEDMKRAIELAPENGANISGEYNNYEPQKNIPFWCVWINKKTIYLLTPFVIQRSIATKDLVYIYAYTNHCITEILRFALNDNLVLTNISLP